MDGAGPVPRSMSSVWMVGLAETQVTPWARPAASSARGQPPGGDHRAARRELGQGRGDEAVHVEQGHRAVGDVGRAEPVVRGDRPDRRHHVALQQRHLLRAPGGAAGVQQQGHVAGDPGLE
jgi:hypothetical protein